MTMTFLLTIWVLDGNNISISMSYLLFNNFHFCSFPMIIINIFRFIKERNHRYIGVIKANQEIVSVNVPANVTGDAAGNKNQPSNVLQVMHRSVPKISPVFYGSTTGSFVVIVTAAGLLTVSIASLNSIGEFSRPSPSLSQSQSNLFRIACHLQVIALSGWLAVRLPVEYYELTRGLRWSIPYLSLPWERETGHTRLVMGNSSLPVNIHASKPQISDFFKPLLGLVGKDHESPAETEHLESALDPSGWSAFGRNMFWLAIIGGGFINVHALLLLILYLKKKNPKEQRDDGVLKKNSEEQRDGGVLKKNSEEQRDDGVLEKNSEEQSDDGVLTSPRFEIIIVNLGITSICQASAAIIRGETALGIAVGVLLLGVVSFLLLAWLLFLYKGITRAHLLEYEEVHQEDQGSHCYTKIVRAFLVLVKEHKWKSTDQQKSNYLPILGSLYEEFRGPPTSKPSQNSGGSSHTQAEAPLSVIQKLCGQLRIYYPLLESVRRVLLATMAGFYKDNSSSKIPPTFSLCINCFHLFFLVLEKPFTKKNIQLLEITAVSSEACISAIIFVLAKKELSDKDEKKFGILMLILVLVGIFPQIMNELYDLYKQIKQLDFENNFLPGLKRALTGLTWFFSRRRPLPLPLPLPLIKSNLQIKQAPTSTSTSKG
ncbi:uncharacterized protein LOC142632966 [Castanea sativa]|uniref:uncharacterized protein LOC142632966 n=1 Tax=Castanea sativa TaxID=21020 RepID=UPI003F65301A